MGQDWTWMQAVADVVVVIVNQRNTNEFSLADVYDYKNMLAGRFPNNRHVEAKIRQVLQRLRDTGLVTFEGHGSYLLDLDSPDVEFQQDTTDFLSKGPTPRVKRTQYVRLRNTLLASSVKERYSFRCQVCHSTVQLADRNYAESHHIRPLGHPHNGSDIESNILVACPNHHVMLDRGALSIEPDSLLVSHLREAFSPRQLFVEPWHDIDRQALAYYQQFIRKSA